MRIASLDDLIRMKRAAGRPKDRIELEILERCATRSSPRDEGGRLAIAQLRSHGVEKIRRLRDRWPRQRFSSPTTSRRAYKTPQ